jgi:hypothetical protein
MNDQERQVISDIFQRLEQVASQPLDAEAERFIQDKVRQQPYAPYAMAQAIYVQEQALQNLSAQLEELRAEVEELRQRPQGGGFLSGLFGGGSREPERARPTASRSRAGSGHGPGRKPDRKPDRCQAKAGRGPAASRAWVSRECPARAAPSVRRRAAAAAFSAPHSRRRRASPAG